MMVRSVEMFALLAVLAMKTALVSSDCLEPDTRVVGRWKNGNYYKGVVESLTNSLNVLFDNGNRQSYNLHSKFDVVEDRIPEINEIKWGDPVVVNRPHSFAFQPAHIREIVGGRYMVWYKDGSYIYQTKNDIRVFNKSAVCNEPAYLGCYRDQVPRYLTVFIPTRPATIAACVDMCNAQSYSVAALRNSDLCFCGNAYNKGYQTSDKRCDMPCYDNPYEKCGGVDVFSQYWTGIVGDKPVYRPSGLQAYAKFHLDPYGFQRTYQSVIRKQSIPRYGKLPWSNILQARRAVKKPSSLAHASPWKWNALTSSWVRADGKQFRWTHPPKLGSKKTYRTWTSSQTPLTKNGWNWNGRAWVSAAKKGTGLQQTPGAYPKAANPFFKSTNGKGTSKIAYYNKGYLQTTGQPRVTDLHPLNTWLPKSYNNVDISKDFTPDLVLQKLADRLRTVKWSQLSNFNLAFKPSSSIPLTFRYLGCFADDYQRDLPFQYSMPASSLTVRSCVLKCREHSFSVAGLQGSTQCFCGNTYSKYGRVREEECMLKCGSSMTDICGGVLRNSVYFTGIGSAWPHTKGTVSNAPKTKASKDSSTHAQSKANDKQAKKVTSAIHAKFGKTTSLSKHKVTKTVQKDSKPTSKKKELKKTQTTKKKARNKINAVPEKDNSGIDDFQVESIKVKVNFSELKKALQALSPEIVRRVQKDLSRMHNKEHTNHTIEKTKVEVEETKKDNAEEYDEKDVEKIRNEIHNKALDRLSNDNIKEILRIMKIPKTQLRGENRGKNFEDAIKSFRVASKKSTGRNGIKVINGKDVAHEEIESYSRISLDIPLRPTKGASKALAKKKVFKNMEERKSHEKSKLKTVKKNMKDKSVTSSKVKSVRKGSNKKVHPTKMIDKTRKKYRNVKKPHGQIKTNINAKSTGTKDVQSLEVQNHQPDSKASGSSKIDTVAKSSDKSNEKSKDKHTHSSATKTGLSEEDLKESKLSLNNKPVMAGRNKKERAKNDGGKVVKIKAHLDVPVLKEGHSGAEKVSHKLSSEHENKKISKDGRDVKKESKAVKSVAGISSTVKPTPKQNSAGLSQSKENDNKVKDAGVSQAQVGNYMKENDQSSAKISKETHEDKQNKANKIPANDDEKVKKSQSQSTANDNGVIFLGSGEPRNDKSQQKQDQTKLQSNSSEQKENVQLNVQKDGDENGVIYLGGAAELLQKSKKNDETKEEQNPADSKEVMKEVKTDKEDGNKSMSLDDFEKKGKKIKDKLKTNYNMGEHKKEETESNATSTKEKGIPKNNDKKESKVTKKYKQNDSEKEQKDTRIVKQKNDNLSSKDNEQKRTAKILNSNTVADLNPRKGDVDLAQSNKGTVSLNSVQVNTQSQPELSHSQPSKTQNDAGSTHGGSGADASGSKPDASQTPFEQENKLLSFQKQNAIYGKSSNAALQKHSSNSKKSLGNINSTEGKAEDENQLGFSGMSETDKVTESKIITKLNNLLNTGSGDDNFEDVVNELENNKIDGISANGITIMMGHGSGRNSSQESSNVPQYSSDLMESKSVQSHDMNRGMRSSGKPVGEDKDGNVGTTMSSSNDPNISNLPTKAMGTNINNGNLGSGLEDVSSGDISTKYTYFGSGANKEELALIRADDLKRLTQDKRKHSIENSGEEAQSKSSLQGDSAIKKGKATLHLKRTKQRLFAKSSIPKPPIYKMILIPNLTLGTKKNRKQKRAGKSRDLQNKKSKKTLSKGKYYSDVKGVRVVKNGVSFTVSKGQSTSSHSSRPLEGKISSMKGSPSKSVGKFKTTKANHLKNNKLKIHHISERRQKLPKKIVKNGKIAESSKMDAKGVGDEAFDDTDHNIKDNGSLNQLLWLGSHLHDLNRNIED